MFCSEGAYFFELEPIQFPCYENLALRLGLRYAAVNLTAEHGYTQLATQLATTLSSGVNAKPRPGYRVNVQ